MVTLLKAINNTKIPLSRLTPCIRQDDIRDMLINSIKKDLLKFFDKKIYIALSGGLDSSLLLSMAKIHFPRHEYVALTIGGSDNHLDILYANEVCNYHNIEHIKIIVNDEMISKAIPQLDVLNQKANNNVIVERRKSRLSLFLLFHFISQHTDKVIVGDGADELFGGYISHSMPRERESNFLKPINWYESNCIKNAINYSEEYPPNENIQAVIDYYWHMMDYEYLRFSKIFANSFRLKLFLPFLSKELINGSRKLPIEQIVSKKEGKITLRYIGKDYLPKKVLERKIKLGVPAITMR